MQFLKPRTVRLYPKLRRWILTDAASSGSSLQPLALAINKRLADEAGRSNENLVFSPLSIYAAPSLVAAEARKRTLAEMLDVLGARSRDDLAGSVRALAEQALADQSPAGGPHVSFTCAGWRDKTRPLKPDYADAAVKSYKAQTCAVDFHEKPKEAGKQINAWVEASTNKIIPSIVDPDKLSNLTDLAVANAIYFKGEFFLFFQQKRVPLQFH